MARNRNSNNNRMVNTQNTPPRNRRRNRSRRRANPLPQTNPRPVPRTPAGRTLDPMTFTIDKLTGASSGVMKFGKNLTQCTAFSDGILRAFHEFKITSVVVKFRSFASSTTTGSIAFEIDTACEMTALKSRVDSYPLKQNCTRVYRAGQLRSKEFTASSHDQFYLLYSCDGNSSDKAGQLAVTIVFSVQTPQ